MQRLQRSPSTPKIVTRRAIPLNSPQTSLNSTPKSPNVIAASTPFKLWEPSSIRNQAHFKNDFHYSNVSPLPHSPGSLLRKQKSITQRLAARRKDSPSNRNLARPSPSFARKKQLKRQNAAESSLRRHL